MIDTALETMHVPSSDAEDAKSGWTKVVGGMTDKGASLPEQVKRMDLIFRKVDADNNPMANIPFVISLLDNSGNVMESHVFVTYFNDMTNK